VAARKRQEYEEVGRWIKELPDGPVELQVPAVQVTLTQP